MKNILLLLFPLTSFAVNPTPDFYKCTGKVGGEWAFGRAPNGCNANSFGSDTEVRSTYSPLIFADSLERTSERKRYMENLHAVIRDAAEYYLKKRKPNASRDEIEAFKLGVLTTASQESFWSHYRISSDNKIKMMRGDFGHGHGMMQVDDRHHFPAVQLGLGWNLLGNMTYSMDEFFQNWERAPTQRCVGSATNWEARIRSAWAAYNGGPSRICRWTDPNNRWAHNDKGFYDKLRSKSWKNYVSNFQKTAPVNVPCLIEKRENCPPPGVPNEPTLSSNVLYRIARGESCIFQGGKLLCLEYRDRVCLKSLSNFSNEDGTLITDDIFSRYPKTSQNRHALCNQFDPSLLKVGSFAELQQAIILRATPGGGKIGAILAGEVAEILDFEIRGIAKDRYYKMQVNGKTGYIYAGNSKSFSSWVTQSDRSTPLPKEVARVGETIEITNLAGINLRKTPGGVFMQNVKKGTRIEVLDYEIQGAENHLYYLVKIGNSSGYIYSGALLPRSSTLAWTVRTP
jgi:hypothetical protein